MEKFIIKDGTLIEYNGDDEIVTVPIGVREIGEACFKGKHFIKEILLPYGDLGDDAEETNDCLKKIHPYAFAETSIESIVIPKYASVYAFAFQGCPLKKITGGGSYLPDSLTDCPVTDIFLYSDTWLAVDHKRNYYTELKNCTLHSKGRPHPAVFEYCYYYGRHNGVKWVYDTNVLDALTADYNKYHDLCSQRYADLGEFEKRTHLKTKRLFGKNKPETVNLQKEYDRISAEAAAYFRTYHLDLEPKIEKEKKRIKDITEEYEHILTSGPTSHSAYLAGLDRQTASTPSPGGAFVPVPDVEGV